MEILARGRPAAVHSRANIVPRRASNILPSYISNGDSAAITVLAGVDTRRDVDGLVNVVEGDIPEGYISDVASSWISLDPCRIRGVMAVNILEDDVLDVFRRRRRIAHATNNHASRLVTRHVISMDVAGVALNGYTVLQ